MDKNIFNSLLRDADQMQASLIRFGVFKKEHPKKTSEIVSTFAIKDRDGHLLESFELGTEATHKVLQFLEGSTRDNLEITAEVIKNMIIEG